MTQTDAAPRLDAPESIKAQRGRNANQYIGVEYDGFFEASIVSDVPGIDISTAVVGPDRGQGTAVLLM